MFGFDLTFANGHAWALPMLLAAALIVPATVRTLLFE
jgi:hypothetical protein